MPHAISMLIADDSTVTQEVLSEAVHVSKLPVRLPRPTTAATA